jgi:hypothetical protein
MPIRYEDRPIGELRALARKRNVYRTGMSKVELIRSLRKGKINTPVRGGIRRSPERVRKYESCVRKVKTKVKSGQSKVNPYAVCNVSVYGSRSRSRSYKK